MIAPVRSVYGSARSYPATTNTMLFPATSTSCASSGIASIGSGGTFWFAAAKPRGRSGRSLLRSSKGGYHHPTSCILTLKHASTPLILHKSRMRRRARTDLSGGRSVMSVPTGSISNNVCGVKEFFERRTARTPRSCFDSALVEELIIDDEGSHVIFRAELGPTQPSLRPHVRP